MCCAVGTDRKRHHTERSEWGQVHDQAQRGKRRTRQLIEKLDDLLPLVANPQLRESEENREQHDLEDVALRERIDHRRGDDVQDELGRGHLRRRIRAERRDRSGVDDRPD